MLRYRWRHNRRRMARPIMTTRELSLWNDIVDEELRALAQEKENRFAARTGGTAIRVGPTGRWMIDNDGNRCEAHCRALLAEVEQVWLTLI